ncbi:MAG: RNA polymerase sigma-70 factor (ECF subfamily) [Bradymonadia bacterium]|jgi:RNA polymerase sigma-70 factor (ECF subfamily)
MSATAADILTGVYREEYGKILATLIRVVRDFELAEDVLQEVVADALTRWTNEGIPQRPAAWLTTAARNRAIDAVRRRANFAGKKDVIKALNDLLPSYMVSDDEPTELQDDRLRLIFTCCHPALSLDAQVALTLHTVGGLETPEIARAFLVPNATLAQRLVRAKKKIKQAGIPYRVPPDSLLAERSDAVRAALYLIFNEGYSASSGEEPVRVRLCDEGIRLAKLLCELMPEDSENAGLVALMMLHDARRNSRYSDEGKIILLSDQDRALWNREQIEHGAALVEHGLKQGRVGQYLIQAAIAALHCEAATAEDTDWQQIAGLYAFLMRLQSSPVIELNRAVAIAMANGPASGLQIIDGLQADASMQTYPFFHSARADLLRRLGRVREAADAYRSALEFTENTGDQEFLEMRLKEVAG